MLKNEVEFTGTLKNVRVHTGTRGTMVTAWVNQRDMSRLSDGTADRPVFVAGINVVGLDDSVVADIKALDTARQGAEETQTVTLKGRLVTRFDRRPGVAEGDRRAPQIQLEVFEVIN